MGLLGRGKRDTNSTGDISESAIITRFLQLGHVVLTPYGDNQRYDLAIEDADGQFWRVQCKTGWVESDGAYIEFKTASSYYHTKAGRTGHGRKDYRGQVNYFA